MAKPGVVARLSMTDAAIHFSIPKGSPIYSRFADENDKPKGHWTFEMRSNPDPKGQPFFAVVKETLPNGVKRAKGIAGGSFTKVSQTFVVTIAGNSLPLVFKHGPFGATPIELYHDAKDLIQFKMPLEKKALILRGEKRLEALTKPPEPEVEEQPAPAVEPPVPDTPAPVAEAPAAPAPRARNEPVIIQPAPVPLNVERAVKYLNKRKAELGSDITFTIVEGGFIRAVQRIM